MTQLVPKNAWLVRLLANSASLNQVSAAHSSAWGLKHTGAATLLAVQKQQQQQKQLQPLSQQPIIKRFADVTTTRLTSTSSSSKGQALSITNMNATATATSSSHDSDKRPSKLDLTFEDGQTAFKSKSNLQLLRGYLVFQLCSLNLLIDNQKMLLKIARQLLGKRLFNALMKSTFYGHFVAGEDQNDIRSNVECMMRYGVKSILDYSAEEDLASEQSVKNEPIDGHADAHACKRTLYEPSERQFEKNTQIFMDCVDAVSDVTNATGIAAVKLTSLVRPALLLKLNTFVERLNASERQQISRSTLEWNALMSKSDAELSKLFNERLPLSDPKAAADQHAVEFTANEIGEIRNMLSRMQEIVENAIQKNVRIFVDAEQTYFQAAIHRLTVELMRKYNRNKCVILNTYQNYLKSAHDTLRADIELANQENFYFGAKLVRGAYMEQERERAKKMGYADPINDDYDATTRMYQTSLMHCLAEIQQHPLGRISVMVASHNEDTVKFAVEKMMEFNIKPADRIICFGQLLGMCDYISFYLGGVGYSVYKYVPYGPVEEVLPYLSRRATENRGIFEKVKKEKRLILNELKRRITHLEFS